MAKEKTKRKIQINNKRASFDYEFLETYEAGIVLVGTEIKSLRAGKASLSDAYCYFSNGELYVKGMNISTYFWASAWSSHEPGRDRKLLLHHFRQFPAYEVQAIPHGACPLSLLKFSLYPYPFLF